MVSVLIILVGWKFGYIQRRKVEADVGVQCQPNESSKDFRWKWSKNSNE